MPNRYLPHFNRNKMGSDVGRKIRVVRQRHGLTRAQLATAAKIASRTLARIERGDQKPRVETLRAIAGALNLRLEALASGWLEDEQRRRDNSDHFGPSLRAMRLKARVPLRQAATAAGVDAATLSRFERMQTDSLRISIDGETIISAKLAKALGFHSVDDLFAACSEFNSQNLHSRR